MLLEFLIYLSTDMSGLDLEPWLDSVVKCSMYTNQYSDKQVLVLYLHSVEQQKARLSIYQNLQDCTSSKDMPSLSSSWIIGQDLDLYLDLRSCRSSNIPPQYFFYSTILYRRLWFRVHNINRRHRSYHRDTVRW